MCIYCWWDMIQIKPTPLHSTGCITFGARSVRGSSPQVEETNLFINIYKIIKCKAPFAFCAFIFWRSFVPNLRTRHKLAIRRVGIDERGLVELCRVYPQLIGQINKPFGKYLRNTFEWPQIGERDWRLRCETRRFKNQRNDKFNQRNVSA